VRYRAVRPPELRTAVPISVLKPLAGLDDGLEGNLRTFFEQSYPRFEILFAVRSPDDAAIAVVERLRTRYPSVPARLLVVGEPPYPNAKVYSLDRMLAAAEHDTCWDGRQRHSRDAGYALDDRRRIPGRAARAGYLPLPRVPGRSLWSRSKPSG